MKRKKQLQKTPKTHQFGLYMQTYLPVFYKYLKGSF